MKYQLVRIETRSRHIMFRVDTPEGEQLGIITRLPLSRSAIHPWVAYLGIGDTQHIGAFYGPKGKQEAAEAVIAAHASQSALVDGYLPGVALS